MSPRASVLVLTYDRAELITRAVASALEQTVADVEVLIVGDGVTEEVRAVGRALESDPRVRFLDYPKGPGRGEANRDLAVREARSNAILYLCDDDLLMPTHVESMLALLETRVFAQSLNCWVDHEGFLQPYAADLANEATIAWHLRDDILHNAISVTGTAHRRDFYLDAGEYWSETPAGFWPDHWQWRRMMAQPGFTAATSDHATALQFPHQLSPRGGWSTAQRAAELDRWLAIARSPDGQAQIDELLSRGAVLQAERTLYALMERDLVVEQLNRYIADMRSTLSWRVTAPLRWLRSRGR